MAEFPKTMRIANALRRPKALVALGLAGLAFSGCGAGDKKINLGVLCEKGSELRVKSTTQPTWPNDNSLVRVTCEDANGQNTAPKSIQLAELNGQNEGAANFNLSIIVDQEQDSFGGAQDFTTTFETPTGGNSAEISIDNIDGLKEIAITTFPIEK